jgi:hypothetical protein
MLTHISNHSAKSHPQVAGVGVLLLLLLCGGGGGGGGGGGVVVNGVCLYERECGCV